MSLLSLDWSMPVNVVTFVVADCRPFPTYSIFYITIVVELVMMWKQLLLSISSSLFSSGSPTLSPSSFHVVSINSSLYPLLIVFPML